MCRAHPGRTAAARCVAGARKRLLALDGTALSPHVQALRPPIAKIGPMAAPQRDGLVAPMPAFAAGGPMPAADAPLAIALEYAACEDLPQVGRGAAAQCTAGLPHMRTTARSR